MTSSALMMKCTHWTFKVWGLLRCWFWICWVEDCKWKSEEVEETDVDKVSGGKPLCRGIQGWREASAPKYISSTSLSCASDTCPGQHTQVALNVFPLNSTNLSNHVLFLLLWAFYSGCKIRTGPYRRAQQRRQRRMEGRELCVGWWGTTLVS